MTDTAHELGPTHTSHLFFNVDARHVRQLGQELVGDKVTALVELVKNAYDADATYVSLDFDLDAIRYLADGSDFDSLDEGAGDRVPETTGRKFKGRLRISDNGSGMTLKTIQSAWMRIASDEKELNAKSPKFGRIRAGRKGIGRFAAESLGMHLTLSTSVEGATRGTEVAFDWTRGYDPGTSLAAVANAFREIDVAPDEHGVTLEIWGLYDVWTEAQRQRVARALLLLQPPLALTFVDAGRGHRPPEQDFSVVYRVNGSPETANSIDAFLEGETAHISATVNKNGEAVLHVTSQVFQIDRQQTLPIRYLVIGETEINASYFIYRKDAIGVPVRAAQKMAMEYGGVRVYRDGLRLLPYGEKNDDWLGLDEASRRREYLNPIGNQNFFAQVLLGRDKNPLLEDTSSREGLINNDAYREFREFVREVLITSALWVAEFRERRARGGSSKKLAISRSDIMVSAHAAVVDVLEKSLPEAKALEISELVRQALASPAQTAQSADSDNAREVETLLNEVELLRLLASLGTSISVFSHEVRAIITVALFDLSAASGTIETGGQDMRTEAAGRLESLRELAKYIDAYSGGVKTREREPQPLAAGLTRFVSGFAHHLARGYPVSHSVWPPSLRTTEMGGTTLQAIYINLFTNAVKALDHESHQDRRIDISVTASDDGKRVVIRFQDSGRGIEPSVADTMFDAFVTTSSATSVDLGVGTGLGLKVVRDLVEEYGGSVFVGEPSTSFKTCIQVELPRWSEQIK